jgi:hypothetical protein
MIIVAAILAFLGVGLGIGFLRTRKPFTGLVCAAITGFGATLIHHDGALCGVAVMLVAWFVEEFGREWRA